MYVNWEQRRESEDTYVECQRDSSTSADEYIEFYQSNDTITSLSGRGLLGEDGVSTVEKSVGGKIYAVADKKTLDSANPYQSIMK